MKNYTKTILYFFLIKYSYNILGSYLLNLIDPSIIDSQTENLSFADQIVVAVIMAPLLETFIAQVLLYYHLRKIVNEKFCFHLSALLFALGHYNSIYLIIALVPIGYLYIILFKRLLKYSFWKAFWGVVIVHMLSNALSTLIDYYDIF